MKKMFLFSSLAAALAISSCKKDCSTCNNNGNNNNGNGYYFKFNLAGTAYDYTVGLLQFGTNGNNDIGGFVPGTAGLTTSGGLDVTLNDSCTSSRINALVHDSLFFDGTYPIPTISLNLSNFSNIYYSMGTTDHQYYVLISKITFMYTDTIADYDIYDVQGSFKAKMEDQNSSYVGDASNGQFNMQCSSQHFGH